ncbi:PREDICTED: zinc-finger homeodomain protein 2-like [Ipomoea nil]|uniref:zinc-finger homeodomain protein 2-like n=1 Tax=Ipomoea nil TaxID=35883 RepID=UPI0009009737|nr:PREDICTED: zinc-finger homeodomain protein 2-like [Ipomoea nil]
MEFEDQEEQKGEEGDIEMGASYDSLGNSKPTQPKMASMSPGGGGGVMAPLQMRKPRYRECLRNHAVGIGGHAVDGCGEFMAAGEDGSVDALKCAACNCHRNFHRKETETAAAATALVHFGYHPHPTGYLHHHLPPPQHRPLALPSTSGGGAAAYREEMMDDMDLSNPNSGGASKKRFRTKFSQEQKDKMFELAEKLEWRIQKQDEAAVQQLCNDYGIRRHVFKVWMHNNKHTLGKKP